MILSFELALHWVKVNQSTESVCQSYLAQKLLTGTSNKHTHLDVPKRETDRQTERQRSDSIDRSVLQTVAQKNREGAYRPSDPSPSGPTPRGGGARREMPDDTPQRTCTNLVDYTV